MLDKLAKYNDQWLKIAYSFLNNKEDAEDIVNDMYLRLYDYNIKFSSIKFSSIKYKDDVNKYFIYTVIRNMCLQHIKNKHKRHVPFTEHGTVSWKEEGKEMNPGYKDVVLDGVLGDINEPYVDKNKILDEIQKEVDTWNWYERTLFEVYCYSGLSLRDLAYGSEKTPRQLSKDKVIKLSAVREGTGISVSSMFHTLKKLKEKIRIKFNNYERTGRQED